jgi:hypothetical protein
MAIPRVNKSRRRRECIYEYNTPKLAAVNKDIRASYATCTV